MEEKFEEVYLFLTKGIYPKDYKKGKKQNLRRYASKFKIIDTMMYYKEKRLAVKSMKEAFSLFKQSHLTDMGIHNGMLRTRYSVCEHYYWPGMSKHIEKWVSECNMCQPAQKNLSSAFPLQSVKVSEVWEVVGIDLIGPLPTTTTGYKYIFTATDLFSKWVEAYPLKTKTAVEVTEKIMELVYRHSCPKRILSDQGKNFVKELNFNLCKTMSIERSKIAAYHPQTNSLDKDTNHSIKSSLHKLAHDLPQLWDTFLNPVLFALRCKIHTGTTFSPFRLMYGREAVYPSQVPTDWPLTFNSIADEQQYAEYLNNKVEKIADTKQKADENMEILHSNQKSAYMARQKEKCKNFTFNIGDEVLLCNGRKRRHIALDFSGPYRIIGMKGKMVNLKNRKGEILKSKVNVSHLKPYKRPLHQLHSFDDSRMEEPVLAGEENGKPTLSQKNELSYCDSVSLEAETEETLQSAEDNLTDSLHLHTTEIISDKETTKASDVLHNINTVTEEFGSWIEMFPLEPPSKRIKSEDISSQQDTGHVKIFAVRDFIDLFEGDGKMDVENVPTNSNSLSNEMEHNYAKNPLYNSDSELENQCSYAALVEETGGLQICVHVGEKKTALHV